MAEAPAGEASWIKVTFGEMVNHISERVDPKPEDGYMYVGLEHLDAGSLTVRRWGSEVRLVGTKLRMRKGDVLFARRNAYLKRVAIAPHDGLFSAHGMVLRARANIILHEFLPFFMRSAQFMDRAIGISVGSLSPTINWTTLAKEQFTVPRLEEQQRLVVPLCAALALEEHLYEIERALDAAEYALLKARFGAAYNRPAGSVPLVALSELADIRTGLAKGRRPDAATTTRPYLSVANVKDGYLDLTEVGDIVVDLDKVGRYALQDGDVLMTEGGDLDKLGRGTVWQEQIPGCLHQNHVFAVRLDAARVDPWYLAALTRSPYGRSYFLSCAKRSSNLASINKGQVSALLVPLYPVAEQKEWLKSYDELRGMRERTKNRRLMLQTMMKGILEENRSE